MAFNHIIKSQVLEVKLVRKKNVEMIQDELRRIFMEEIVPDLDLLFTKYAGPKEIIRIESLTIDVGKMNINSLDREFKNVFIERLKKNLKEIILETDNAKNKSVGKTDHEESTVEGVASSSKAGGDIFKNGFALDPSVHKTLELFIFFLKNGHLPWSASRAMDFKEFENATLLALRETSKSNSGFILKQLNSKTSVARLWYQFSEQFMLELMDIFVPEKGKECFVNWKQMMIAIPEITGLKSIQKLSSYEMFLHLLLADLSSGNEMEINSTNLHASLFYKYLTAISAINSLGTEEVLSLMHHHSEKHKSLQFVELFYQAYLSTKDIKNDHSNRQVKESGNLNITEKPANTMKPEENKDDKAPEITTLKKDSQTAGERTGESLHQNVNEIHQQKNPEFINLTNRLAQENGQEIYINNAGVVIVANYLPYLFASLGWITLESLKHKERAAHLVQFISTGLPDAHEYEMTLPKLLCGINIGEPIPYDMELLPQDRDESEMMLQAVIKNWSALKNTGSAALRDAFFQREGKLVLESPGVWNLQVEQKSYDVLLEKLPWSFGLIKLPWMEDRIRVDWI